MKRGEITLFENQNDALFDVVDRSRDGRLTFEEYKVAVSALNSHENAAKATYLIETRMTLSIERSLWPLISTFG